METLKYLNHAGQVLTVDFPRNNLGTLRRTPYGVEWELTNSGLSTVLIPWGRVVEILTVQVSPGPELPSPSDLIDHTGFTGAAS